VETLLYTGKVAALPRLKAISKIVSTYCIGELSLSGTKNERKNRFKFDCPVATVIPKEA
jgi:hypothetical protein